jgi:hypothetical protein
MYVCMCVCVCACVCVAGGGGAADVLWDAAPGPRPPLPPAPSVVPSHIHNRVSPPARSALARGVVAVRVVVGGHGTDAARRPGMILHTPAEGPWLVRATVHAQPPATEAPPASITMPVPLVLPVPVLAWEGEGADALAVRVALVDARTHAVVAAGGMWCAAPVLYVRVGHATHTHTHAHAHTRT